MYKWPDSGGSAGIGTSRLEGDHMHRRNFIRALAGGSASVALLNLQAAEATPKANASVRLIVKGFTCVTCSVGLKTILEQHKGIGRVTAEYPSGIVEVGFNSHEITPPEIKRLIENAGFKVREEVHSS